MTHPPSPPPGPPREKTSKLGQTVWEDLGQVDFQRVLHRDLKDVYDFYLDDASRRRLGQMDRVSRGIHMSVWLVKSSILKLPPTRRLLLLASLFLFFYGGITGNLFLVTLSFLSLALILLLELKDKLLAQDELATGRAVQFALLPKGHPTLPGWDVWLFTRPANEVGGDLVDYVSPGEGRLGVALGDVAGKGLGAALVMAKLQSTLRALAPRSGGLAELGVHVNEIFRRDGLPSRFVTLAYLEVEPGGGRVRLLNAGHLPPLLLRREEIEELPKGGPAIGLLPEFAYAEQSVDLDPDDLLLVYSDGLTEARNEAGAFFGDERLRHLLAHCRDTTAESAGRYLLSAVDRFIGEARPSDDLSLVLLRRTGRPALGPGSSEDPW